MIRCFLSSASDIQTEIIGVGLPRFDQIFLITFYEAVTQAVLDTVDIDCCHSMFGQFVDVLCFVQVSQCIWPAGEVECVFSFFDMQGMFFR